MFQDGVAVENIGGILVENIGGVAVEKQPTVEIMRRGFPLSDHCIILTQLADEVRLLGS